MEVASQILHLIARQDAGTGTTEPAAPDACQTGNGYDGRLGLRIAAVFVIWFGSTLGAVFPVFAYGNPYLKIPNWAFFIAKFFGSGVIIATAFIHLLAPAHEALTNPCLTGPITEYAWVEGIVLMMIFLMFFIELMIMRYAHFGDAEHLGHAHEHHLESDTASHLSPKKVESSNLDALQSGDHLGHVHEHTDIEEANSPFSMEDYSAQLTAIFILEFGVIFHSVFIGLTLAVAGEEFITLFIVLVFHQTFEGLGLGSRLAITPWPRGRRWTPYVLALAYGFSTPIAIAIGLGVRQSYPPEGRMTLLINGVFDSISAGILIYVGLVELMAHEFMFSTSMRKAKLSVLLSALFLMCLGAGLMALLGKWA